MTLTELVTGLAVLWLVSLALVGAIGYSWGQDDRPWPLTARWRAPESNPYPCPLPDDCPILDLSFTPPGLMTVSLHTGAPGPDGTDSRSSRPAAEWSGPGTPVTWSDWTHMEPLTFETFTGTAEPAAAERLVSDTAELARLYGKPYPPGPPGLER